METKAIKIMEEIRNTKKFDEMSEVSSLAVGYTVAMLAVVASTDILVIVKEEVGGGNVSIRFIVDKETVDMAVEYDGETLEKTRNTIRDNAPLEHCIDAIINMVKKNHTHKDDSTRRFRRIHPDKFIGAGMVQMFV